MFFTAISIAIILRNNIPLGPVCLLLQHTAVAPVASAPRDWPPKPRFMILFPLPVLQPSPESWPARGWQLRMTKCHVLQINYLSAWAQHTVDPCQLSASPFMTTRKTPTALPARLELTKASRWLAWQTPKHSPFHLSSLAKLARESLCSWHSELLQTLCRKGQPTLPGCRMKLPPLMSALGTCRCPPPAAPDAHPTQRHWQGVVTREHLACVMGDLLLCPSPVPHAHSVSMYGHSRVCPHDTFPMEHMTLPF